MIWINVCVIYYIHMKLSCGDACLTLRLFIRPNRHFSKVEVFRTGKCSDGVSVTYKPDARETKEYLTIYEHGYICTWRYVIILIEHSLGLLYWRPLRHKFTRIILLCTNTYTYHLDFKVWDKITYPFSNFNVCTVDIWEWICNIILHFMINVITYPCWDYSWMKLVKSDP